MSYWSSSWIYLVNLPVPLGKKSSLLKAAVMKLRKCSALLGEGEKAGGGGVGNLSMSCDSFLFCGIVVSSKEF